MEGQTGGAGSKSKGKVIEQSFGRAAVIWDGRRKGYKGKRTERIGLKYSLEIRFFFYTEN